MKCPKNAKRFASKIQNGLHIMLIISSFAEIKKMAKWTIYLESKTTFCKSI